MRYGERAALVRVTASVTFEDAKKVALREWNIRSRYALVCGGVCGGVCGNVWVCVCGGVCACACACAVKS